jgi:hypothetical protein
LAAIMMTQIMPSDPLSAFLLSNFSDRRKRLREISEKIQMQYVMMNSHMCGIF